MNAEDEFTRSNRASWNLTAEKYADEIDSDITSLEWISATGCCRSLWQKGLESHQFDPESGDYFDTTARANLDFPASAVRRYAKSGETPPVALERQWNLGQVITAISHSGLIIERLEESPEHYWAQFPNIPAAEMRRIPHSFLLIARAPT